MPSPLASQPLARIPSFIPPVELTPQQTLVLLGAGSSAEAGFPAGTELDAIFRGEDLSLYTTIADATRQGSSPDVERVLRVLEHFAEPETDGLAHDLALLGITYGQLARFSTADRLPRRCQREIRDIRQLLRQNLWHSPLAHRGTSLNYLTPLIDGMTGGTIATLNYDNSIELAGGKQVVTTLTKNSHVEVPATGPKHVRLLKLHGSLDWRRVEDDVLRDANPAADWEYEPGIIFGSGNKLRAYGPFLQLLRQFHDTLSKSKNLVVLGYSWRDPHINAEIRRWSKGASRTLYVSVLDGHGLAAAVGDLERHNPKLKVDRRIGTASKVIGQLFSVPQNVRVFKQAKSR